MADPLGISSDCQLAISWAAIVKPENRDGHAYELPLCLLDWTSAADLKFLHLCRKIDQELKIERRHWNRSVASAPLFPKFVFEVAATIYELRKRGTRGKSVG
jgi:hypothetical protein